MKKTYRMILKRREVAEQDASSVIREYRGVPYILKTEGDLKGAPEDAQFTLDRCLQQTLDTFPLETDIEIAVSYTPR